MAKLRVFISWSGMRSKKVAQSLYNWLPTVLQNVETWMSAADIEKGTKWRQVLSGELAMANFGIVCLSPENLQEPWLLFEAGALSKATESRVCTYLSDLEFSTVEDPLSDFWHTNANKEATFQLLRSINSMASESLAINRTELVFEALWPRLARDLATIQKLPEEHQVDSNRRLTPEFEMLRRRRRKL